MAIEIHIRVRESDWDSEYKLAQTLANKIENLIPGQVNIPILILPVEDSENEMEKLFKFK